MFSAAMDLTCLEVDRPMRGVNLHPRLRLGRIRSDEWNRRKPRSDPLFGTYWGDREDQLEMSVEVNVKMALAHL
jgi:hypothetical protein